MSASTSSAANQSLAVQVPDVRPKRQWGKIIVSSILGGVVAVVAAPTITASAPAGIAWLIASNMTAGIVGSVTTKIAGNAIGAGVSEIDYNPHRARLRFRTALVEHFDSFVDPVIDCIRSNTSGTLNEQSILALTGSLVFLRHMLENSAQGGSQVYLRYNYQVIPKHNSPERSLDEGAPPPDLPVHHADATATLRLNEPDSVLDGVAGAVARGAIFGGGVGLLGQALGQTGPLFERMFVLDTAPGMNMVFAAESVSGAADPICNLIPGPSSEERAAYLIELIAEIQHHVNRVSQCAINNGVGLVFAVELGVHNNATASAAGTTGTNSDTVWNRWEARIGV
ncbi:hypothetical protein BJX99DRAFT_257495 [Aspergillus californicus]